MRKIKFRGKRVSDAEWVYGNLIVDSFINNRIRCYIMRDKCNKIVRPDGELIAEIVEVIPQTVGQFTGMCDKNGKEIFEGDLLHHRWQGGNKVLIDTLSEVKFRKGAFVIESPSSKTNDESLSFDVEISSLKQKDQPIG